MNGAVKISWGTSIPGREVTGLEVFGRAVARFEQMAKEGRVHGHHEYFSITGPSSGFMMIEGELDELMKILAEEETIKLNEQASSIVSDFEIQAYAGGTDQATQQLMTNYTATMAELGYMRP